MLLYFSFFIQNLNLFQLFLVFLLVIQERKEKLQECSLLKEVIWIFLHLFVSAPTRLFPLSGLSAWQIPNTKLMIISLISIPFSLFFFSAYTTTYFPTLHFVFSMNHLFSNGMQLRAITQHMFSCPPCKYRTKSKKLLQNKN